MQLGARFLHLVASADALDKEDRRRLRQAKLSSGPGSGGHNSARKRGAYTAPLQHGAHARAWYGQILNDPTVSDPESRRHKEFVSEFRVPHAVFLEIVDGCRGLKWARDSTGKGKCRGRPPASLEVKVLAVLYRLGAGCMPRTTARLFNMSKSLCARFFQDFCAHHAQTYSTMCRPPETDEERQDVESVYRRMGMPGCLGSTDGVHVAWSRCPAGLLNRHKGAKGVPTRSFNITVDHRRFIQHVASSKPGALNDKTAVRYDSYIGRVRGGLHAEYCFAIGHEHMRGGWIMCDGGYHRWRVLQCPRPHDSRRHMRLFSRALESVRKDVECTFGILKGRFRILKLPFECQHEVHIDNVMYTCASLHNRIQRWQGMADVWIDDMDWTGVDGLLTSHATGWRSLHPPHGQQEPVRIVATSDFSSAGWGCQDDDAQAHAEESISDIQAWKDLGEKLARNYELMYDQRVLQWPRSMIECAAR